MTATAPATVTGIATVATIPLGSLVPLGQRGELENYQAALSLSLGANVQRVSSTCLSEHAPKGLLASEGKTKCSAFAHCSGVTYKGHIPHPHTNPSKSSDVPGGEIGTKKVRSSQPKKYDITRTTSGVRSMARSSSGAASGGVGEANDHWYLFQDDVALFKTRRRHQSQAVHTWVNRAPSIAFHPRRSSLMQFTHVVCHVATTTFQDVKLGLDTVPPCVRQLSTATLISRSFCEPPCVVNHAGTIELRKSGITRTLI